MLWTCSLDPEHGTRASTSSTQSYGGTRGWYSFQRHSYYGRIWEMLSHPKVEGRCTGRRITVAPSMAEHDGAIIRISFVSRLRYNAGSFFLFALCPCVCVCTSHLQYIIGHFGTELCKRERYLRRKRWIKLCQLPGSWAHKHSCSKRDLLKNRHHIIQNGIHTTSHYTAWVAWLSRYQYTRSAQNPV